MTHPKLEACPFCGGPVQFHKDNTCPGCHYIQCLGCESVCDMSTGADPHKQCETLEDWQRACAIKWNRRAGAPAPQAINTTIH